jgi:hypothetical protein
MAHEPNTKLKLQYTVQQLQEVEDDLTKITENFREIRREMVKVGLDEVGLKLKTFLHYMGKMQPMVSDFQSEVKKQAIIKHVQETRERIREQQQKGK